MVVEPRKGRVSMTAMTLVAPTGPFETEIASTIRPIHENDRAQLADLYAHAHTGTTNQDQDAAGRLKTDIDTTFHNIFDDARHPVIPEASLVSVDAQGCIIAGIVIIDQPSEDGSINTAFITELFTHPHHRRQGLAEDLLRTAIHHLHKAGRPTVAVTLDDANAAAMALYLSMDFRRR